MVFIGHDTGLLKKVKVSMKREENAHLVSYGQDRRTQVKRMKLDDGEEKKITIEKGRGTLSAADNQRRVRYETDIQFKLLDKAGAMQEKSGVLCTDWTVAGNRRFVTMLRGQSGVVSTYDSLEGTMQTV